MKLVVQGLGIMGQYSVRELAPRCEKVYVCSSKPQEEIDQFFPGMDNVKKADNERSAFGDADFVLYCVPTDAIYGVMERTLPFCKKGAIISGQTSRKAPEMHAFDRHVSKNPNSSLVLVTIHTMCNPKASDASKEILGIIRHNSSDSAHSRARDFYGGMSEHVEDFGSIYEHDTKVANTQINTSRTFLSIASAFARVGCFPGKRESYSGAFDVMKFALAMRVASQESHVYRGIQFDSQYGKDLVRPAVEVERELFEMIVGDKKTTYRDRILDAKRKLFKKIRDPILTDEEMSRFGELIVEPANSDFSLIQWGVAAAESRIDIFQDLKATTPMYTALVCLTDRLFNTNQLERAMNAPFENPQLRSDDLRFHDEVNGWSDALLFDNEAAYNSRHGQMRGRVDEELLGAEKERSKEVIGVCREALARFTSA